MRGSQRGQSRARAAGSAARRWPKRMYTASSDGATSRDLSKDERCTRVRKRPRCNSRNEAHLNTSEMLRSREIDRKGASFTRWCSHQRFCNTQLKAEFDTHDPDAAEEKMPFQRVRSKIVEVVSSRTVVFALTKTGLCIAFDRARRRRLCAMNMRSDEVVRSLFLNKANNSLITVSVFRDDNFSSLKCRSTPITYIERQRPEQGMYLFESESLKWPGFVEFDDVNAKVLTFSAETDAYKVWELVNYTHLYTVRDARIQEIKVSPGIMLLVFKRSASGGYVPLQVANIENGEVMKECRHLLHRHRKIDFIEQFNEKLLVKQEGENLQIVDVKTGAIVEVERSSSLSPSAFIFLYDTQLFLTFRSRQVSVWNFRGELVTTFEDHQLSCSDYIGEVQTNTNNIYITSRQDLIVSYCRMESCEHGLPHEQHGSINVSSISRGKCLAKITCDTDNLEQRAALEGVSALFYNEDLNEIYTGSRNGIVHMWST